MEVARALVTAQYTTSDRQLTLRDHRGDFYRWDGTCWPDIDKRDIRGAAYRFLEHAVYLDETAGSFKPFAPPRRKIDDVVDALRAVTLLGTTLEPPCWTTGRTDPLAHEIVSMANGLLHVSSRTLLPHSPTFFCHHSLPFDCRDDAPPPSRTTPRWRATSSP